MYNSQYYTCEQIDERLLQGYLDDYNTQTGQSLTKAQFLTKLGSIFSKEGVIDNTATQIGYYECYTAAGTAAKTITVAHYALFAGGSMKVKFENKNTANNATLNINSQGAKALYYQGERASATNSWDAEEVVEIYYDGTSYYANNVKGGSGSGVYDVSKEHPTSGPNSDGKFTLEYILNSSNVNELIPVNKRYPGMTIQFVSTSDNKYAQFRLMADEWSVDTDDWSLCEDVYVVKNPEFIEVKLDKDGRIIEAIYNDGSKLFGVGVKVKGDASIDGELELQGIVSTTIENPEFAVLWAIDEKILFGIQKDGNVYYGAGIPRQIEQYVEKYISDVVFGGKDVTEIIDTLNEITIFLEGFVSGSNLLDYLNETYGHYEDSTEYINALVDAENKILEAIKPDGTKVLPSGKLDLNGFISESVDNPEWLRTETDNSGRILNGIKRNGNHYVHNIESETIDEINKNIKEVEEDVSELENIIGEDLLKVVINNNGTFYVRSNFDDSHDIVVTFAWIEPDSFQSQYFYIGNSEGSDAEIIANGVSQNCRDTIGPVSTANFGPIWANHGYCTPRVVITNHGLTDSDIDTEWVDNRNYHYTIGHISGNSIYLLPIIYNKENPGYETRDWKYYGSPYPTSITRVGGSAETLNVDVVDGTLQAFRYDYRVCKVDGLKYIINGKQCGAGTYYCNEIVVSYTQIGYNPIKVDTWWPKPIYNGEAARFERQFTVSGCKGFLCITNNQTFNNLYPYKFNRYLNTAPTAPTRVPGYDTYSFVPKLKKVATVDGVTIDFSEEFNSTIPVSKAVTYYRNSDDLISVDDMPDRVFHYLKNGQGDILYGVAGGHSIVSGLGVKSIRNSNIPMGEYIGYWNGDYNNKFYAATLRQGDDRVNNILTADFIAGVEGYMCWYKPVNNVHTFYHKTDGGYVVYIHTKENLAKGIAYLPDFMNGMGVKDIVENTKYTTIIDNEEVMVDAIKMLTNVVVNGRLFFTSDNSVIKYNYIVLKIN